MSDPRHDSEHSDGQGPDASWSPAAQPTSPGGSVAGLGYTGAEDDQANTEPAEDGVEGLGYTGRELVADDDEELNRPA